MDQISPLGPVYQAGTLSGNPLAMSAGIATLNTLKKTRPYALLEKRASKLVSFLEARAREAGLAVRINRAGSMFTIFFNPGPVADFEAAGRSDTGAFAKFFHRLLDQKIYFPPSQFEAAFLSAAQGESVLDQAAEAISRAFKRI